MPASFFCVTMPGMTHLQEELSRRGFLKGALAAGASPLLAAGLTEARILRQGQPVATLATSGELTRLSIREASELLRKKKVSPVELTKECLARIERYNPALNAFITVTAESALAEARAAEAEIQRGRWRGPLHGIPIALKDLFDTKGVRTTAASELFKDRIPTEDAEVVRRLKAAGAVFLGKQNMHEFAYGSTSVFSYFGAVHNPWHLEYMAGGSSGGSAAAVSAELCFGALGSDTGGSIRGPAACCGIVGLKPTYGLVSTRGAIPLSWSRDHVGPLTRHVADAAIMLQAIAGYDPEEVTSVHMDLPKYSSGLGAKTSTLRLGVPRDFFYAGLNPEIEASVKQALDVLGRLTSSLRDSDMPVITNQVVTDAEAVAFHAETLGKTPELYMTYTRGRLSTGAKVTARAYIEGRREQDELRRNIRKSFAALDVLVTPTTPIPARTIVEATGDDPLAIARRLDLRNCTPFNINGLPSISIPCGFTSAGLPIGLQISGPHGGEAVVLQLAYAYEQATEWHKRRPPL
ncbi:MAG: amidase [Acidobacteria bacterium]|nr:amidase [Acidobacteriota bacterium]